MGRQLCLQVRDSSCLEPGALDPGPPPPSSQPSVNDQFDSSTSTQAVGGYSSSFQFATELNSADKAHVRLFLRCPPSGTGFLWLGT